MNKNRMLNLLLGTAFFTLSLSSCSGGEMRQNLGLAQKSPDEFLVQPRNKLVIPDRLATPLPVPQQNNSKASVAASANARKVLFGETEQVNRAPTQLEAVLANKTGAINSNPAIRNTVEKEFASKSGVFGTEEGSTLNSILDPFDYNSSADPVIDGKEETKRIKEALKNGQPINSSEIKSHRLDKERIEKEGSI